MSTLNKTYALLLIVVCIVVMASCRKDFDFAVSSGSLLFSKDTVFLDTIFANIGSSTYTLKVYNQENQDVVIPRIALSRGLESSYRLNVDGLAGKIFTDIPLLARDSLFIFIETTVTNDILPETEFLYTDVIQFETPNSTRSVPLVTLVKDAIFLFPQERSDGMVETLVLDGVGENGYLEINGFELEDSELEFTNAKPYVIYGYAAVPEGKTLSIAAGTRVHFHSNSGIVVNAGGNIQITGTLSQDQELLENEVIFEGDRLEPEFSDVPGQWGTIWLRSGSTGNQINHLTLKNAAIGLLVDGPTSHTALPSLTLANSLLFNSVTTNLWARGAKISAANVVFGNSGASSLYCNLGGDYSLSHCTIANYWSTGFRNAPALRIDHSEGINPGAAFTNVNFSNCVIDGNRDIEFLLAPEPNAEFDFNFRNCAFKFNDRNGTFNGVSLFDFTDENYYQNPIINPNAAFVNPLTNDFRLTENTEIRGLGDLSIANALPLDILGNGRTELPDLGAFQFVPLDFQ